jgi:hypothetical protein
METEQPCPYCKRVHYSSYTAERCAARHDASCEYADYVNEQRKKDQKQKRLQTGREVERPGPFKEMENKQIGSVN